MCPCLGIGTHGKIAYRATQEATDMMEYTDRDMNGNTWPKHWVDVYNSLTVLIENTYGVQAHETYLNDRHRFYVMCCQLAKEDINV